MKLLKWVFDPGHGGDKPGAIFDADVTVAGDEIEEEDINLAVVLKLGVLMREKGHSALFTRDHDVNLSLEQRKNMIAEYNADAFVSIHCNATEAHKSKGVEAFYRDAVDKPLAVAIQQALAAMTGLRDRGVFQDTGELGKRLVVLNDSPNKPAALVELGFLDSTGDREYIVNNINTIAEIIADACHEWAQTQGGAA